MIKPITQYIITCDTPGCGKQSGVHHDIEALTAQVMNLGWRKRIDPDVLPSVLTRTQFRCFKCVRANEYPEGWTPEGGSGTEN